MAYIRFKDSENVIKGSVLPMHDNVVRIITDAEPELTGFRHFLDVDCVYPHDNGEYESYTTLYRQGEGWYELSNDGSVYEEVAPVQPEPYEPTEEELQVIFERNKENKIEKSKAMLAEYLEANPILSTAHGGIEGCYSVTTEKQTLMMSQYMTYQIEKQVNPDAQLTWNETGKSCEVWTEEEFLQLILEIKAYVYPKVSYQQAIEEQINACTTEEELAAIVINYAGV